MKYRNALYAVGLVAAATAPSCGGAQASAPEGETVNITPEGSQAVADGECVRDAAGKCVELQSDRGDCGAGADFDVITDSEGNVLDIICYPPQDEGNSDVILVDDSQEDVRAGNNDVILLDGSDDGADVQGDLEVTANNVSVIGAGPDVSVIDGDVSVEKNNLAVRQVSITGNVNVDFNNAAFALCVIHGDVVVNGNNLTLAGCDIFGNVTIEGNNTVLIGNRIAGTVSVTGENTACDGNRAVADANENHVVDEGEVGGPIPCSDDHEESDATATPDNEAP
jgi:hypothetical protein